MNVCMVGYGMMCVWHIDALTAEDVRLHTLVGRRPEPTRAFAERYGYGHWTVDLEEALADPEIDVVVIASPSESHPAFALKAIAAGKHTLLEIPIAMTLEEAEVVVAAAEARGVTFGRCHPRSEEHTSELQTLM